MLGKERGFNMSAEGKGGNSVCVWGGNMRDGGWQEGTVGHRQE